MTYAVTIGSYAMPHFIELQIASVRHVWGADTPILVSDDASDQSERIEAIAAERSCAYIGSQLRRGHFAGDMQSILNSLSFGAAQGADIAIKISQRMVIADASIRQSAESYLADPNIAILIPGRLDPRQICGSKGFVHYPYITDCVLMRVKDVDPEALRGVYVDRWKNGKKALDCFVETLFEHMLATAFLGRFAVFQELTHHVRGQPKKFHRRYMSTHREIRECAKALGMDGYYQTAEWKSLDRVYSPRPLA